MTDEQFFATFPDRQARIRTPNLELTKTLQRAVRYKDECSGEFWSLGSHDKSRRRVILWRVPENNPWYDAEKRPILKIPFLLFADETVEDNDATLLPIIHQIMTDARART